MVKDPDVIIGPKTQLSPFVSRYIEVSPLITTSDAKVIQLMSPFFQLQWLDGDSVPLCSSHTGALCPRLKPTMITQHNVLMQVDDSRNNSLK